MARKLQRLTIPTNPIEYRNQRVVTFELIDQLHERPNGTASRNFHENRHRFTEGEDFFRLSKNEIRILGLTTGPKGPIVLTESGYLILVKSFTDDRAWQVQKALVSVYFRSKGVTEELRGFMQELKGILKRNDQTLSIVKDLTHQGLSRISDVTQNIIDIRSRLPRRDFPSKTKRLYREVSLIRFGGHCQIHPNVRIVDDAGNLTVEGEYDHFFHHSENGQDQGWIISKRANRGMMGNRQKYEPEFRIFQRELESYLAVNRSFSFSMPKRAVQGDQMRLF